MGKDLQTLNGQNKLAQWAGRISECRNSGQNVAEYSAAPEPGVQRMRATIPVDQSQCSGR